MFINHLWIESMLVYVATYLQVISWTPGAIPYSNNHSYIVRQSVRFYYQSMEAIGQAMTIV